MRTFMNGNNKFPLFSAAATGNHAGWFPWNYVPNANGQITQRPISITFNLIGSNSDWVR